MEHIIKLKLRLNYLIKYSHWTVQTTDIYHLFFLSYVIQEARKIRKNPRPRWC